MCLNLSPLFAVNDKSKNFFSLSSQLIPLRNRSRDIFHAISNKSKHTQGFRISFDELIDISCCVCGSFG